MKRNIVFSLSFLGIIVAGLLSYIINVQKEFSEDENRYLTMFPKFSMEKLLEGDYTKEIDSFATDQFVLRSEAISLKTQIQKLVLNKDSNGVYFSKDGYLMLKKSVSEFDEKRFKKNLNAVAKYVEIHKDLPVYILLAPTAASIYSDKLPEFSTDYDQKALLERAKARISQQKNAIIVDVNETLTQHLDKQLYYKTDHHWTTLGAYLAYTSFCTEQGIEPVKYDCETVADNFFGTLYSKVLAIGTEADSIECPKDNANVVSVVHQNGARTTNSLYEKEKLRIKDKYQYFLGGNEGEVCINTSVKNGKHLLLIKDSYANCMLPFLANHYESIHVIDLRFFGGSVTQYMKSNCITETLILYNLNNFDEDTSIAKLMIP